MVSKYLPTNYLLIAGGGGADFTGEKAGNHNLNIIKSHRDHVLPNTIPCWYNISSIVYLPKMNTLKIAVRVRWRCYNEIT